MSSIEDSLLSTSKLSKKDCSGFFEASFTGLDLSEFASITADGKTCALSQQCPGRSAAAELIEIKRNEEARAKEEENDEMMIQEKASLSAQRQLERAEILKTVQEESLMNKVAGIEILNSRPQERTGRYSGVGCYSALASMHESDENGAKREQNRSKRQRGTSSMKNRGLRGKIKAESSRRAKGVVKKSRRSKFCTR